MKNNLNFIILTVIVLFSACKKDNKIINTTDKPGKVSVTFDAVFGSSDFALNKPFTSGTKTYNFNTFRYWVSNVILIKANGEQYLVPKSYFLLEETGAVPVQEGAYTYPATKRELIELDNIPAGEYKGLKFGVGVESRYNDNLSLTIGELSQLNGMTNISWMWHTSYIFTAIGGSVAENSSNKTIKIETGLNENYKTVSLNFPNSLTISDTKSTEIQVRADIAKALDGIDVISTPRVGASQATTMTALANNYQTKVFTVTSVK